MPRELTAQDLVRRSELRRMKAFAASLLVLAALLYLFTLWYEHRHVGPLPLWVGYLRAATEAGMVGGLADWFAVTALFRHPLGLPIPHTAIIPTRKDAIGASLGDFVGENFLAEDVIRDRVRRADLAGRAGAWLADEAHAERVTAELASLWSAAMASLSDADVQAMVDQAVTGRLAGVQVGPALGRLLGELVADGAHRGLVDLTVDNVCTWLEGNEEALVDVVARQAPAWSPRFVDLKVAERVYTEVLRVAHEVRADPLHPIRGSVDQFLTTYAQRLREDVDTQARVDDLKQRLLSHDEVRRAFGDVGATARRLLVEAAEDPDGELRRRICKALAQYGRRLVDDLELRATANRRIEDAIAYLVTNYRAELTTVISETVERWDGEETSRRIELQVGRDLQFIRINGTVVGAMAGIAIYAVSQIAF